MATRGFPFSLQESELTSLGRSCDRADSRHGTWAWPPSLIHIGYTIRIHQISCHLKPNISDSLIICATPWKVSVVFGARRFTNVSPVHSRISRCQVVLHDFTLFGVRAARGPMSKLGRTRFESTGFDTFQCYLQIDLYTDIYCNWRLSVS